MLRITNDQIAQLGAAVGKFYLSDLKTDLSVDFPEHFGALTTAEQSAWLDKALTYARGCKISSKAGLRLFCIMLLRNNQTLPLAEEVFAVLLNTKVKEEERLEDAYILLQTNKYKLTKI